MLTREGEVKNHQHWRQNFGQKQDEFLGEPEKI